MYQSRRGTSGETEAALLERGVRRLRRWARGGRLEALGWTIGLAAMAALDPQGAHLFSLCPLDTLGLSFCPGCGLGHAIAHLARGNLAASVQAHPLGVPAVLILGTHVTHLLSANPLLGSRMLSS
jgi:hypothetical protein